MQKTCQINCKFTPQCPHSGAGTDPLLAFETQIFAGGFYFVPPLSDPKDPITWLLPE